MAEPKREKLKVHARRCVLVTAIESGKIDREHALDEMRGLVETAGSEVVGTIVQVRDTPDPATYIGSGKVEELKHLVGMTKADLIVFDNHLSPSQGKHLEEETNTQVVDRSEVILDIFATHARTYEAKLQVELAQLLYMRPRLTRMWTHLERIEGGIGSGKGPGEKQLETDRRLVDKRISELKRKLSEVEKRRELLVAGRREHKTVSLVGYTNAGKSTLMNALTGADVYVADKLFATLDTRTRKWNIPHWGDVLLSDTVGFIKNLPHHLVASFRSTLEEARHADLLLHVVDGSHPEAEQHIQTVNQVLAEIGVEQKNTLLVLNKLDAAPDRSLVDVLRAAHPKSLAISAREKLGLDRLVKEVAERLADGYLDVKLSTSVANGRIFAFLSEHAEVTETEYLEDNQVRFHCRLPRQYFGQLRKEGMDMEVVRGNYEEEPSDDWWRPETAAI